MEDLQPLVGILRASDPSFWTQLDGLIRSPDSINRKLPLKAIINISSAISYSYTVETPHDYYMIIINMFSKIAKSPEALQSFNDSEISFFLIFNAFCHSILTLEQDERNSNISQMLLNCLIELLSHSKTFKNQMKFNLVSTILQHFSKEPSYQCNLLSIDLLFLLIDSKEYFQAHASQFFEIALNTKYPWTQFQICTLLSQTDSIINDIKFNELDSSSMFGLISTKNQKNIEKVINLHFYDNSYHEGINGWMNIGFSELYLYFEQEETFTVLFFKTIREFFIDDKVIVLIIGVDHPFPKWMKDDNITFRFAESLKEIFSNEIIKRFRVFHPQEDIEHIPKSSFVIYTPNKCSYGIEVSIDESDSDIVMERIPIPNQNISEVPPPILYETCEEKTNYSDDSFIIKEGILTIDAIGTIQKLEDGINTVEKNSWDKLTALESTIREQIDEYYEEIDCTSQSQSKKYNRQIQNIKSRFNENVRTFSRKEEVIHQNLVNAERDIQKFTKIISEIQIKLDKFFKQNNFDFQRELDHLRKSKE